MRADIEQLGRPIGPRKLPELRASYAAQCRRMAPPEDAPLGTFTREQAVFGAMGKLVEERAPLIYARRDFTALMVDAMASTEPSNLPEMMHALVESESAGFLFLEEPTIISDEGGATAAMRIVVWLQSTNMLFVEVVGTDGDGDLVSTTGVLDYSSDLTEGGHVRDDEASTVVAGIVAASLLAQGGIVEREDADMRPPARKGKPRRPAPAGTPPVVVVDLRRSVAQGMADVAEAEHTYQHRWIVRGHWRNQPHGPGRAERRRVYIAPYVKGPDGAPLLQHEKVYRW